MQDVQTSAGTETRGDGHAGGDMPRDDNNTSHGGILDGDDLTNEEMNPDEFRSETVIMLVTN
jgi:hypothetical protein